MKNTHMDFILWQVYAFLPFVQNVLYLCEGFLVRISYIVNPLVNDSKETAQEFSIDFLYVPAISELKQPTSLRKCDGMPRLK